MNTNSFNENKKALQRLFYHFNSPFKISWESKKKQEWNYLQSIKAKAKK